MMSTHKNIASISVALIMSAGVVHAVTPESELDPVTLSTDNLPKGLEIEVVSESCTGCHQIDISLSSIQASTEWVSITEQSLSKCGRAADK